LAEGSVGEASLSAAAPDLLALLAQHSAGQAQDAAPSGGDEREPIAILKQMIDLAKQYLEVEPDEEDKATMAKTLATLQQYLGKEQADTAQALGQPAVQRVLRKS
jgi:hypothetical protein